MSKQQKQHKIKICYFHQLLQWESPNVRKRSVKEHLLKKKNIFFQTSNELPLPPRPQPVFFATTESNRIAGRRVMLADHDPGAGGSWMGGRGQAWREGQHGGQPILCKPTPICRPALYASSVHHGPPALFRRCQIFFLNADCSQTVSRASKAGPYVTEIVKCRPNPATGRKYQTNKEALI